jgi:MinD-like ATPase involved in chromosome partitioning or flagellar assembly
MDAIDYMLSTLSIGTFGFLLVFAVYLLYSHIKKSRVVELWYNLLYNIREERVKTSNVIVLVNIIGNIIGNIKDFLNSEKRRQLEGEFLSAKRKENIKMEIISFFSYKGGVGRTYLTVQLARCLAALGKKVVIADFDFDAPSIPGAFHKADPSIPDDYMTPYLEIKSGLFELFWEYAGNKPRFDKEKNRETEMYAEFKDTLFEECFRPVDIGLNGGSGYIKIFPGGQVKNKDYWKNTTSSTWIDAVNSNVRGKSLEVFLKEAVEPTLRAEGVDYLLIDTRAGITYYGDVVRRFAPRQVMLITQTDETKSIMVGHLLSELTRKFEHAEGGFKRFVFAAGRVPHEYLKKEQELFLRLKEYLEERTKGSDKRGVVTISKIASDMRTYHDSAIRMFDERYKDTKKLGTIEKDNNGNEVDYNIVPLHLSVLKVLAALLTEPDGSHLLLDNEDWEGVQLDWSVMETVHDKDAGEEIKLTKQACALWEKIYGKDNKFRITSRNIVFEEVDSRMLNIEDRERNVSLKVETLSTILSSVSDKYGIGKESGEAFAASLEKDRVKETSKVDKVKEWCRFDSRVGFGQFDFVNEKKITVKNAFIMEKKKDEEEVAFRERVAALTPFFNGYVKGVLGVFGYKDEDITEIHDDETLVYEIGGGQ